MPKLNPRELPYDRKDFKNTETLIGMGHEERVAFSWHNLERYFKCLLYDENKNCKLCGKPIETFEEISLDHVLPKSRGGRTRLANLQIAHRRCNSRKGSKMPKRVHPKARIPVDTRK